MAHGSLIRERERMSHMAQTLASETYEIMLSEMSKTRILEAYLMQTGGSYEDFGRIAHVLLREEFLRNVLFAPEGIVAAVYPLNGNEDVIGLNMYEHRAGNKEAQAAIEKRELYVAGPFALIQGGLGVAGRLPVFLEEDGEQRFWGIVSVTLDFPEVLTGSSISRMEEQGFSCEVWRINPDTQAKQILLKTNTPLPEGRQRVDHRLSLFNADWVVSVAPLIPWYSRAGLWLGVAASVLLSLAVAVGAYSIENLRRMRAEEAQREIQRLQEQLEHEQGKMLLSQIRSHFFYHTLNGIQALIIMQPDDAYKMAGDFARYLRFSLDAAATASGLGSFREEMRAVRAYADINEKLLGGRLTMVYDVPEKDFEIPLLTIQPIVENAILHGIKPKVGGGTVSIGLAEDAD
ncbi:MAG: histidine kinase, partial [Clostridia bacterium]|nr:histidine kinase [Clostridia bacterium]